MKVTELTSVNSQLQDVKEQAREKEQELTEVSETLKMQLDQTRTEKETMESRLSKCEKCFDICLLTLVGSCTSVVDLLVNQDFRTAQCQSRLPGSGQPQSGCQG